MEKGFTSLVKESKSNSISMSELLVRLKPLIKSYTKKLFFMEKEDAEQEILLAIIKAVKSIPKCESDGECLAYINNSVKFTYANLCKKNIRKEQYEDPYEIRIEEVYFEKYEDIDAYIDLKKIIEPLSYIKKKIFIYLLLGYSDREVAEKLGVSRQYINRIKKKLINQY